MSAGAVSEAGGGGVEEIYLELDSSPSRAQEHDYLSYGSPLPPGPVPSPGPAAGGEKI